jgi:hypothetical protein
MVNISLQSVEIHNNSRILLLAPADFDEEDAVAVTEGLQRRFPEADWAVLTGGFQVINLERDDL